MTLEPTRWLICMLVLHATLGCGEPSSLTPPSPPDLSVFANTTDLSSVSEVSEIQFLIRPSPPESLVRELKAAVVVRTLSGADVPFAVKPPKPVASNETAFIVHFTSPPNDSAFVGFDHLPSPLVSGCPITMALASASG